MVFVKVRETYDLHTIRNKMSIIGIHTPSSNIIKRNYPGLLMQCKAYRPVSADVRLACASMMPLDPQGVGTAEGDVAPEDVFNPILYKALSNFGMSQIDNYVGNGNVGNIAGTSPSSIDYDNDVNFTKDDGTSLDQFDIYYGLLSQTHHWRHANPQQGLMMSNLNPIVYDLYQTIGDNRSDDLGAFTSNPNNVNIRYDENGTMSTNTPVTFRGKAHPLPMMNCTTPTVTTLDNELYVNSSVAGFGATSGENSQIGVPAPKVYVGCIIVPPSRLHQLFYRLVVEWTLEFSMIRPVTDLLTWSGLAAVGDATHYMSYSFAASKSAPEETDMVDTSEGSDIKKVM